MSSLVAVICTLRTCDLAEIERELKKLTGGMEDFFDNELTVLDVEHVADQNLAWQDFIRLFKSFSLQVVAARHVNEKDKPTLRELGLSIDVVHKNTPKFDTQNIEETAQIPDNNITPAPASVELQKEITAIKDNQTIIIDTPVRAGQRIYARGADLIVTAGVNNGAEVIADGNIHIYGTLRGRALSGALGNTQARIFCAQCEAELISIAGIYRTFDTGHPKLNTNQPVQVQLKNNALDIQNLKIFA